MLIHSTADRHLGCFHFLGIMSNATTSICVHISMQICMLSYFLSIFLGVELLIHVIILVNFLRKCHPVFCSSCIILHFYQHEGSTFSSVSPTVVFLFFIFYNSHPNGCVQIEPFSFLPHHATHVSTHSFLAQGPDSGLG